MPNIVGEEKNTDELLSKMWEWVMDGYPQDCHDF